ncbi:uncharacterized protein [Diabrotica undecimpunctata]|uniref:uncharacterized protein isoform X2 n=1 Tax=Diabrotica undecimpunctata TaxID=50387 RepID=UPI003B63E031
MFHQTEVKQEVGETTCKREIIDNEVDEVLQDTFKIEIKEEPIMESTDDSFDDLDNKECHIKAEIEQAEDSQNEDVLQVIQNPKHKPKRQKTKYENGNDDLPQIVELKAQYLQYQIEEMKERLKMKKDERVFQAKLQALQLKEKQVEVDILLQQKRKIQLENEALESKIKECKYNSE